MRAVIPTRGGICATGYGETVSECDGRVILIGEGCSEAAIQLEGIARHITIIEAGDFAPAAWARYLAPQLVDDEVIVLPASPDGRDLAPRLAFELGVHLYAGAVRVTQQIVELVRWGGLSIESIRPEARFVATLQVGARDIVSSFGNATVSSLIYVAEDTTCDVQILRIAPPDVTSIGLAEASRIVAVGAGVNNPEMISKLESVATAIGASLGATRVVTDRGWVDHVRQIGTTGVVVAPKLYIAFGISGAVQHTSGLGQPRHIIAINIDESCPMMQLADLAVVADANEVIAELDSLLTASTSVV